MEKLAIYRHCVSTFSSKFILKTSFRQCWYEKQRQLLIRIVTVRGRHEGQGGVSGGQLRQDQPGLEGRTQGGGARHLRPHSSPGAGSSVSISSCWKIFLWFFGKYTMIIDILSFKSTAKFWWFDKYECLQTSRKLFIESLLMRMDPRWHWVSSTRLARMNMTRNDQV